VNESTRELSRFEVTDPEGRTVIIKEVKKVTTRGDINGKLHTWEGEAHLILPDGSSVNFIGNDAYMAVKTAQIFRRTP